MPDFEYKMIAGLGNPGLQYASTRHNIGFTALDAIAADASLSIDKTRFDSLYTRGRVAGKDLFLIKPQSYMNKSGFPLQRFASYYKIDLENIIVIHDDMDLPFGRIKVVKGRGHGGHNGVRSILQVFGKKDCVRIRMGVGHPGTGRNVTGHVLGRFSPEENAGLEDLVSICVAACRCLLQKGIGPAMNQFNNKS